MKITTQKIISIAHPDPCRKILAIEGLKEGTELPPEYRLGVPRVEKNGLDPEEIKVYYHHYNKSEYYLVRVGQVMPEENFQVIMAVIQAASERLQAINLKYKVLLDSWQGEEDFNL